MTVTDVLLGGSRFAWISATLVFALGLLALPGTALARPAGHASALDSLHDDPDVGSQAEGGDAELEGTLEILHEDREDGSGVYRHFLSTHDGKRFSLEGVRHPDLLTGDLVRVRGVRSGQKLQLQTKTAEALQVLQFAPLSNTFGPQKTAVFLVNFADNPSYRPWTTSAIQSYVNDQVSGFFAENSYQQTSLVADVFGWYTMPFINAGCPTAGIRSYADQAATAAGINLSGYTRRVYLFPWTSCAFAGMAFIGGNPSIAWLNGNWSVGVFAHELGHNLGLYHSHSMSCAPAILGPNCTTSEYGDSTDIMGGASGHFNPFQKQRLGWLDYGASPPIIKVTSSGTYTLDAYDTPGTTPKALKIQRGTTAQAFFVRLSRSVGFDRLAGVYVYLGTDGAADSFLLDMTPETASRDDGNLDVGQSFTDPISGITITTVSVSDTSATIMVDMGGTGPSCTRSAPTVTGSPGQSPAVQSGTMLTYNVSVTNTDSAACSASTFTLAATAPTTSWLKSFGAASVTAGPGATVSTTLRITSPIVPAGSYAIVSAATRTTASPPAGSGSMQYNVAADGPPAPPGPTFTDMFDRPDAPVLGNGWSAMTGSPMLQSGEARNPPNSTFSLVVQASPIGAAQTVAASFASTNNNSAPRFGVVVRYRDPQNYYICYRQVGGSSVVRIAKMQNGAETVLKSVGIGNPALNAFSKLSCQASGSTLTLRVDGVTKLSMTDGSFSTGSAGYTVSTKQGSSHRVDNFSAIVQ